MNVIDLKSLIEIKLCHWFNDLCILEYWHRIIKKRKEKTTRIIEIYSRLYEWSKYKIITFLLNCIIIHLSKCLSLVPTRKNCDIQMKFSFEWNYYKNWKILFLTSLPVFGQVRCVFYLLYWMEISWKYLQGNFLNS